ncbi:MbcA/ParS/Xre antitoxin family protein [Belnapia sp. F-4-1]|uniref:MbcA/ParS/Xre antitoxin family protein n=1 Tax=Belnapia sp. F-4-1 TaxID=1545443 RepID=UPI0005B89B2B|nr:MbcA/ParS/Xre antitoxin family protein [Belnapia sp. F-4-1]
MNEGTRRQPRPDISDLPENVRATIHLYAWAALKRLAFAAERAKNTKWETTARAAYAEIERLLDKVEEDARRAGRPLVRPPLHPEGHGPDISDDQEDDLQALRLLIEQRQAGEFFELEDPVLLDAALLTWDSVEEVFGWLHRPHPLLNGRTPAAVAAEGDAGRQQVLDILGRLRAGTAP